MIMHALKRYLIVVLLGAAAMVFSSCATIHGVDQSQPARSFKLSTAHIQLNQPLLPGEERPESLFIPKNPNEPLIMLAISGGGSRAAYYASRVMQELDNVPCPSGRGSVLDNVRVISGVSAGSLAAAWYIVNYDTRRSPDFFQRFCKAMAVNLQWRTYGHMVIFPPAVLELVITGLTRTELLANEIEKLLGRPATFNDLLSQRYHSNDPPPIFIANGTVYNTCQRLVMTNLPPQCFPPIIDQRGKHVAMADVDAEMLYRILQPMHFEDIGSDIGSYRVAEAVAASAAYPILLAPYRLKVYPNNVPDKLYKRRDPELLQSSWVQVADGGLYDNLGVDSLVSIIKTFKRSQPVLLIVIDADAKTEIVKLARPRSWGPLSVIMRLYDIGALRPLALYSDVVNTIHDPNKWGVVFIRMEAYDAKTDNIVQKIPTAFKIDKKHREVLDIAAAQNVARMSGSIIQILKDLRGDGGKTVKRQGASRTSQ
ncbi:MAG: patatin-like phospholipase family protein [bacterium]